MILQILFTTEMVFLWLGFLILCNIDIFATSWERKLFIIALICFAWVFFIDLKAKNVINKSVKQSFDPKHRKTIKKSDDELKYSKISTNSCSVKVRAVRVLESKEAFFQISVIRGVERWFVWR